jgi:hypothetical protein
MASDLEQLDADVRAVVADGNTNAQMIEGARARASSLTRQVAELKVAEVDLSRLVHSLAHAESKLESARDLVRTANVRARGYAASHLAGGGSSSSFAGAPSTVTAPADLLGSTLADKGLRMADVGDFDFGDNPITGWDKAPREDVEWAVSRWNDTLAPGIAAGQTRDDFAAMDAASIAPEYRRLANVWDYFLGDDAIHSGGSTPSGGLDVGGGRHRLQVARDLGIRFLPIRFH